MKKLLSTALVAVMATGSIASANAAVAQDNKSVQVLDSRITLANNTLNVFTYNLSKNSLGGVCFYGKNTEKQYAVQYKDCIGKNTVVSMPSSESYTRFVSANGGSSGNSYASYSFANTGGEYAKLRVKLSDVSSYFNSDGSYTDTYGNGATYTLRENESNLTFFSGGAANGVAPDENGCVEIYIKAELGTKTEFSTYLPNYSGILNMYVPMLCFGNIDLKGSTNVNDVTLLQQFVSGAVELDSLQCFYADINQDGTYDIRDVTALQNGIAGY